MNVYQFKRFPKYHPYRVVSPWLTLLSLPVVSPGFSILSIHDNIVSASWTGCTYR